MSSSVDLSTTSDIAYALSDNTIRTLITSTLHTNWTISYISGPSFSLTTAATSTEITQSNDKYYPFWFLILIAVFGSITSVLTVLGNILVMLAFFLDRQIRQPTNYFILSLSVSDFLIGLLSMPLLTIYIYAKDWPLNAIICDIWLSLDYTVCLTSIYTVLFITIDRFCSVKMPAKYRKWRTKSRINMMIAITWAVPTLIFFTSTMIYPRLQGMTNLQNGVCDVQWNKNQIFNLCLTIGYFWTTLFVMIVLYIFIYDVASALEKKSQENARKMSSLVGMAGSTMTQIGVGIGVTKPSMKMSFEKEPLTKTVNDKKTEVTYQQKTLHKQYSNTSSERRHTNDGNDDENSNSFESHSDIDLNNKHEKKQQQQQQLPKPPHKTRRGMSVNWGSHSTTGLNLTSTRIQPANPKHLKSFAHSFYRNSIRLGGLAALTPSATTAKLKVPILSTEPSRTLTPIPSESELGLCRVYPPPQPRPESLAIMSDELFHEKLKARHSPLRSSNDQLQQQQQQQQQSLSVNTDNHSSTTTIIDDKTPTEDISHQSNQNEIHKENHIETNSTSTLPSLPLPVTIEDIIDNLDESSDESWRLLNSNSSLDIPYIDETDFEDLGYILHRRCVPPIDSNQPIHEETIVYKSPLYIKHKHNSKSSLTSINTNNQEKKIHEIYGNHNDAHKAILESPMFDSVELITYASKNSNPFANKVPIRHCSLRHVPREILVKTDSQRSSLPVSSTDIHTTSSIIFISKAKRPLSQTSSPLTLSPSTNRHADVERALIDFYQCTEINDIDENLTTSESDILSNYNEINKDTCSLLHLNERYSSAFIDDEYISPYNNNLMKYIVLNKTSLDTTSDERTLTNSVSLNTYSQDFSVDRIFQQFHLTENLSGNSLISSPTSSTASNDKQIPQHLLAAIEKKRNTSSDSDAITTTTTLTASTLYDGSDKQKLNEEIQKSELNLSSLNNRIASKVTFESFVTQNSVHSSPKTKDQSVMVEIDFKDQLNNNLNKFSEQNEIKNGRISLTNDTTVLTGLNSNKSSLRELLHNQKSTNRRKSKSQNRARKALRTITFILGAFVVCWTPWHIYSAIHSLCESCKNNWIFTNPMFHCFYFLCYLNSPINPFCYALANQQFKKTFTRILKLDLRRL